MILPFSTQLNAKPTYFVEKILKCFDEREASESDKEMLREAIEKGYLDVWKYDDVTPKLHTIRKDEKNRWRPGTKIDFFINCRQEDMFRFAPVLPVVSIQEFEVNYVPTGKNLDLQPIVFIDKKFFYHNLISNDTSKMFLLAKNDGFDSIPAFFDYFNKDFKGKIIHWTDLSY